MARKTIRELKREHGVSQVDIDLARETQRAQRKAGHPVQPVAVLVGATPPRRTDRVTAKPDPETLLDRQLRKRGTYDQAALMLDRQALAESSPERAMRARDAAKVAKELGSVVQLEFDFFGGGNVSTAFQYQDAVTERLFDVAKTPAQAYQARAILGTICRHLGWQSHECTKTASQLCEIERMKPANMTMTLKLLEDVGAITRIKRGRVRVITVTPEGAFRGDVNQHGKAVERYKLDVIDGGQT